jgi:hypothetical protein
LKYPKTYVKNVISIPKMRAIHLVFGGLLGRFLRVCVVSRETCEAEPENKRNEKNQRGQ